MTAEVSTVLLRLEAPMQSWGDGSRFQVRRTADVPTKSGVLGLILCARGLRRAEATAALPELLSLRFAVRVDRAGVRGWDYHTAGAGYGIRSADGKIKHTASTKEFETQLSRREYLFDASFVAGLEGDHALIERIAGWLNDPVWPIFLGRKSCVPTWPAFERIARGKSLLDALAKAPSHAEHADDGSDELRVVIDHPLGEVVPPSARVTYDLPRAFGVPDHAPRWVVETSVRSEAVAAPHTKDDKRSTDAAWWKHIRKERLAHDHGLCVFCKSEAEEMHHVSYERSGAELLEDLRSLCRICHDACTALEYGTGMTVHRVDPLDPSWRATIAEQISRARCAGASAMRQRVFDSLSRVRSQYSESTQSVPGGERNASV